MTPFGVSSSTPGAVRVLLDLFVVRVAEADGVGERAGCSRRVRSGSASRRPSPAARSARGRPASSAPPARAFPRVDADRDDVELLADVEVQHLQRAGDAVEHLRAEHRALVIDQREQHRPLAEVVAELARPCRSRRRTADRAAPDGSAAGRCRSSRAAPASRTPARPGPAAAAGPAPTQTPRQRERTRRIRGHDQ